MSQAFEIRIAPVYLHPAEGRHAVLHHEEIQIVRVSLGRVVRSPMTMNQAREMCAELNRAAAERGLT